MTYDVTPDRVLHRAAGFPEMRGFTPIKQGGSCRICGLPVGRGMLFSRWLPSTATDWDLWHAADNSPYVCEACAWARAGRPGMKDCLRMESHFWNEPGGWTRLHRCDYRATRRCLEACLALPGGTRWLAAIAGKLGRKHAISYAAVNQVGVSGVVVGFDGKAVKLRTVVGARWVLLDLVDQAIAAGLNGRWILAGGIVGVVSPEVVMKFDRLFRGLRGSSELELAVRLNVEGGDNANGREC